MDIENWVNMGHMCSIHTSIRKGILQRKKTAIQLHVVCIVPYLLTFCRGDDLLLRIIRGVMGPFNNFGIILYL